MEFPTLTQIVRIHLASIEEFGGEIGILKAEELKSFIDGIPQAIYFGNKTIIETAAYIFVRFVQNHFFVDGNKRIGYAALLIFLDLNNCQITNEINFYDLTMEVAKSHDDELDNVTHILKSSINCD